jgi:hypothetical protein
MCSYTAFMFKMYGEQLYARLAFSDKVQSWSITPDIIAGVSRCRLHWHLHHRRITAAINHSHHVSLFAEPVPSTALIVVHQLCRIAPRKDLVRNGK